MKRVFLMVAFIATAFVQHGFAQDSSKTTQLLQAYRQLKDNLVRSNATATSDGDLVKAINATGGQIMSEKAKASLLKDAEAIAQSGDLKLQRERFSSLSNAMFELAKTAKFSADPVYQQYCPMKKGSWLNENKDIKNPYYGSATLTCGSVKQLYN